MKDGAVSNSMKKRIDLQDEKGYLPYTSKAQRDKAFNSLLGILAGIEIDRSINADEVNEIQHWCGLHRYLADKMPFREIYSLLDAALEDGMISDNELQDILWCCEQNMGNGDFYDAVTASIQYLQGMLHGILADGEICDAEIFALKNWLVDHDDLESTYPYDELFSLITMIVKDGLVTEEERDILKVFFSQFFDMRISSNVNEPEIRKLRESATVQGICALGPCITIEGKTFCFTGDSSKTSRLEFAELIHKNGGLFNNSITKKTDYLIVGNEGNSCWAFSCYGRKIEKAMQLRQEGQRLIIAHENDFWDSLS